VGLERWVLAIMERVLLTSGQGPISREYDGAEIAVSNLVGVDGVFEEALWNIVERFARREVSAAATRDPERYAFLWSSAQSPTDPRDWLHARLLAAGEQDSEVLRAARVLDRRRSEVTGVLDLVHSAYCSDAEIIRGLGRYLRSGERPEGACTVRGSDAP
jgi:hypothetical protein